jgi:hypothetical protein
VESVTEKNDFKNLFSNSTSRLLLGVWLLVKGSGFSLKSVAELISVSEDILEPKLQTLAGMGLVHVVTDNKGNQLIEFLPSATSEIQKIVEELFESRKSDFESVELKLRSLIYKNLLSMTL